MPKSKTNKDRKPKVEQFKIKQKMSNQKVDFPSFIQVPTWDDDAEIVLTGREFSAFRDFFSIFSAPLGVMQDVFTRNLDSGKIKIEYQDPNGKVIAKEEIEAQLKEYEELTKEVKVSE